jgi:predicted cupin superfamily sugar epimerase
MDADALIAALNLGRHPEGGWYRETYAAPAEPGARPAATAILFLLRAGERSHWHRVDADEIWLWHAGAPLTLSTAATDAGPAWDITLGPAIEEGETPQAVVPAHHWQAATTTGAFTLVSCVVAPGFRFAGFTLAPAGFDIPRAPR